MEPPAPTARQTPPPPLRPTSRRSGVVKQLADGVLSSKGESQNETVVPEINGPNSISRVRHLRWLLRRREKRTGRAQNFVSPTQLTVLPFEFGDPRRILADDLRPVTSSISARPPRSATPPDAHPTARRVA